MDRSLPAPAPVRHRCIPPGPKYLRYLHQEQSISGICCSCSTAGTSPVPAPGAVHLRYLHREQKHLRYLRYCARSGTSLLSPVPAPGWKHLRHQHRGQSIAVTSTRSRVSPVPTQGEKHLRYLRYLHRGRGRPGLSGRGARPDRPRAKRTRRFLGVGEGEAPLKQEGEGLYFSPTGERRPRSSEPVLKVKSLRVPELAHLPGNNALPRAHLPLPSPGLGFRRGEGENPTRSSPPQISGGRPHGGDRERLEKQRRPGLK